MSYHIWNGMTKIKLYLLSNLIVQLFSFQLKVKFQGRQGFLILVWQPLQEKKNFEFKPVKLCLKIDLVLKGRIKSKLYLLSKQMYFKLLQRNNHRNVFVHNFVSLIFASLLHICANMPVFFVIYCVNFVLQNIIYKFLFGAAYCVMVLVIGYRLDYLSSIPE